MTARDPRSVRDLHLEQQALLTDAMLEAGTDAMTDREDDCRAAPVDHTARYRLELEWRKRRDIWQTETGE